MSEERYDLVAIGTGVGSVAARKMARAGRKVALIDERAPGGTCALRGCTPKKILCMGAEALDLARRMRGKGVATESIEGSWRDLRAFMKDYTDPIPGNNRGIYEKEGVTFLEGTARFLAPDTLAVRDASGTERVLLADKVLLATGAHPAPLEFPGAEHVLLSDGFFELLDLPRRLVFLGGGFISMEFAHIAARFGAQCHVVQRGTEILKGFEPFLAEKLRTHSAEQLGIAFHLNSQPTAVEKSGDGFVVRLRDKDGNESSLEADAVVHGAGRIPNIDALDLARGAVAHTPRGITVNEYLQSTTSPIVYASGDCANTGAPHLTLVAGADSNVVFANLMHGNSATVDYTGTASVVFTLPPLGRAGMLESEARAAGLDIDVREADTARWFTNRLQNWGAGGYKVIMEQQTGRLLGVHLLAHRCEEFLNIFALAIRQGLTREDLKRTLWAHPSSASDMGRILG